jgi:hypothetical protein
MNIRRILAQALLLALPLSAVVGCSGSSTADPVAEPERSSRTVGMWVEMLWFDDPAINYYPWAQYTRFVPTFGQYNSYDYAWIDYTLQKAEELGVDYLILDDTNGVFREDAFDLTIEHYLTEIKRTHSNIKIAIGTGFEIWNDVNWPLFLSSINHLEQYFSDPAYYRVDGNPLVVLFIDPWDQMCPIMAAANNAITVDECNAQYASSSDPMGYRTYFTNLSLRYSSGSDHWFYDALGLYGWQFVYPQIVNADSMGAMPGWNRAHNNLGGTTFVDRKDGDYYRQEWEYVLSHAPQNVVITSWDDWAEETAIAPATDWGDLYFDLTKHYIGLYKSLD